MTVQTQAPSGWTILTALRAIVRRVVGALRTAVEIYDEGRALEVRTLASLDDDVLRNMGIDPAEVRYWRNAEKTIRPMGMEEFRRAA